MVNIIEEDALILVYKEAETEIACVSQRGRIRELEAHLQEAKDKILDLIESSLFVKSPILSFIWVVLFLFKFCVKACNCVNSYLKKKKKKRPGLQFRLRSYSSRFTVRVKKAYIPFNSVRFG